MVKTFSCQNRVEAQHSWALHRVGQELTTGSPATAASELKTLITVFRSNVDDENWQTPNRQQDAAEWMEMLLNRIKMEVTDPAQDMVRMEFYDISQTCIS